MARVWTNSDGSFPPHSETKSLLEEAGLLVEEQISVRSEMDDQS